jgi:hypothetical protein
MVPCFVSHNDLLHTINLQSLLKILASLYIIVKNTTFKAALMMPLSCSTNGLKQINSL